MANGCGRIGKAVAIMGILLPSSKEFSFQQHMAHILELSPDSIAVEAGDHQISWSTLKAESRAVEALLLKAGVADGAPVGWSACNRPTAIVSFIALIMSGRMVVPLRPSFGSASFADDISVQQLQAVIGDAKDWSDHGARAAAQKVGSAAIEISGPPFASRLLSGLETVGPGLHREITPGFILERLTSGTTGAPKRIPVSQDVLIPSLRSGKGGSDAEPVALKRSPALLFKPFSHAGGLFGLLAALYDARPIVLFEKFNVQEWVEAVKKHRPKAASLVPAMIRMILEAAPSPAALSSLLAIRSGTAALEPEVQAQFEARYGIPILVDYGAAEFIGGLAGWTLKEHQDFAEIKRGSVGRARRDVQLRVVHPETFSKVGIGETGLIEVKSDRYGADWIRTNDLARIDDDGFIFLEGRADDAINRGGFKVLPEEVANILRTHADIADAIVIGRNDTRLGQVPIAVLEFRDSARRPIASELNELIRAKLPAYMVPVLYHWVAELPRTVSLKVDRPALLKLLDQQE